MRYLVLTDIHSNVEALESCCERAKAARYDAVVCCGDIVGYGPNPREVIAIVRDLNAVSIRGNHDRVAAGLGDAETFNANAKRAVYWTRSQLEESDREYLAALPIGPLEIAENGQLVHGSFADEDDYIFTDIEAAENFLLFNRQVAFFGHTHLPVVYSLDHNDGGAGDLLTRMEAEETVSLDVQSQFLINPGSVGQPRDGDPRACFAIWDTARRSVEFYRVEYAFTDTQAKMRKAGLPAQLIDRLILRSMTGSFVLTPEFSD